MNKNKLSHIAFILDGNKRWAKNNNVNNSEGYSKGFENINNIVNYCISNNFKNLTLFTLSSENFNRPSLNLIYEIIYKNFTKMIEEIISKNKIRVNIFGSKENLPKKIINIFNEAEASSANNKNLNLNLAFNYGFKDEIKKVLLNYKENINSINLNQQNDIKKLFYLNVDTDPEILIRTGGYQRLSNFIMYNLTYTELFFTKTLWPDFSITELEDIINKYHEINRKYGL